MIDVRKLRKDDWVLDLATHGLCTFVKRNDDGTLELKSGYGKTITRRSEAVDGVTIRADVLELLGFNLSDRGLKLTHEPVSGISVVLSKRSFQDYSWKLEIANHITHCYYAGTVEVISELQQHMRDCHVNMYFGSWQ